MAAMSNNWGKTEGLVGGWVGTGAPLSDTPVVLSVFVPTGSELIRDTAWLPSA
jgi:hypothetical protein